MKVILVGVISSLFATIIYSAFIYFLSRKFKKQISIAFNKLFNTGITHIYKNQIDAKPDIYNCFKKSENINILTLRGKSFLEEFGHLSFIIKELADWQNLKFLMANPNEQDISYAKLRGEELERIDHQPVETFLSEIEHDIEVLQNTVKTKNIIPRMHNTPAVFRLIIFDNDLFVLFYSRYSRAMNNQVYRCPSTSELYTSFKRYFNLTFEASELI